MDRQLHEESVGIGYDEGIGPVDHGLSRHSRSIRISADEPVVELEQALDDDLGLPQDGHEVRVAVPARDDVPVEVAGEPGPGGLAQIQADIVALRAAASGRGPGSSSGPSRSARRGRGPTARPASRDGPAGRRADVHCCKESDSGQPPNAGPRQTSRLARSSSPASPRQRKHGTPPEPAAAASRGCTEPARGPRFDPAPVQAPPSCPRSSGRSATGTPCSATGTTDRRPASSKSISITRNGPVVPTACRFFLARSGTDDCHSLPSSGR